VLRPGGVLRINVPDLTPWIAALVAGDTERGLDGFFPRSSRDDANPLGRHRYMYDFELLNRLLVAAGFTEIKRCERRDGNVPDLMRLENRSEDGLYVEAMR
jgi:hypothetical protein